MCGFLDLKKPLKLSYGISSEQMKGLTQQKGALIIIVALSVMSFYPTVKYRKGTYNILPVPFISS